MPEKLEIKPDDLRDTFTTLLLNLDNERVSEIAKGMVDGHVEVTVIVAGVEIPGEVIFKTFGKVLDHHAEHIRKHYDADRIDQMVHEESEAKLKDEAAPLIEKLHDLTRRLENIGLVLTPYWEKTR